MSLAQKSSKKRRFAKVSTGLIPGDNITTQRKLINYRLGIIDPGDFLKEIEGGTTGFIASILPYLNLQEVTIFGIGNKSVVPWKTYNIIGNVEFIPISNARSPSKVPMRLKCLLSYLRNRKKILESPVDVLYVHSPECCLPFLFFNRDIPVIYHQHGSANPVVRSKYAYAHNSLFQGIFGSILKLIYKKADWIIAIDRLCYAQAVLNGACKKTSLLMNAVDTEKFKPNRHSRIETRKKFALKEDQQAILFVGRLEKPKGPGSLLECIPFLKDQGLNFHIFFAGDGTYRVYLENYIVRNRFETQVTFLGHVSHVELPLYYNMSDVLVLPSEMEGVPMVILEALACGTPVVASNVGGIPDVVTNNVNGIVIDDLSSKSFATEIIKICIADLSRHEISTTVEKFSSSIFVLALQDIIANILKKEKKR